jgi:hypothetical protein
MAGRIVSVEGCGRIGCTVDTGWETFLDGTPSLICPHVFAFVAGSGHELSHKDLKLLSVPFLRAMVSNP